MTEQQTNLLFFYKGWDDYQALLVKAIAPLSSAQLDLRVAPHLRSIGENVAHIISGRVSNFHIVMGEGKTEMASLEEWDLPDAPPRSAAELVRGLESTWQMIQTALGRWTPTDLDDVFTEVEDEQTLSYTRQQLIWGILKHDLHHGGEVSFTLGMHQVEALDL
jgi:uncharacterized damage-inducible protein DinB